MGTIFDLDLTGLIKEKSGAPKGDAHELYCRSILMRLGFEVGKADLSASSYDVFLMAFENFRYTNSLLVSFYKKEDHRYCLAIAKNLQR